jgi:hypothetical protein
MRIYTDKKVATFYLEGMPKVATFVATIYFRIKKVATMPKTKQIGVRFNQDLLSVTNLSPQKALNLYEDCYLNYLKKNANTKLAEVVFPQQEIKKEPIVVDNNKESQIADLELEISKLGAGAYANSYKKVLEKKIYNLKNQ